MAKRKLNPALTKPLTPTAALAEVVGKKPLARSAAIKAVWNYIKKKGLQDKSNKRNINLDATMAAFCGKKKTISMFDLAKYISSNLK